MAKRTLELEGSIFGLLVVLYRSEDYRTSKKWACECRCGQIHNVTHAALKAGVKSCGCSTKQLLSAAKVRHKGCIDGKSAPEYQSYIAMMHRCYNKNRACWERYGGKGIIVSEARWLKESPEGYLNFLEDMGQRPENTTLDRVDSEGNYCKENCRWSDKRTQAYNTKRVKNKGNTSVYRGVCLGRGIKNPWVARIGNGLGGYEWLGSFGTELEAAKAYNQRAVEIYGENAILNEFSIDAVL